ncbi:MAG: RagB/SusD family nutrient uptake outer membrane protein [Sphingobacteriales bacterium]|nr:MAG: RagB/SusD family nutrient uptake outer membrane protein [Sphingobacteriales bacterium]
MKANISLGIVFLFTFVFASCEKFLAVKSDKKLVVPKTLSDVQGLLDDAAYMNLRTTPSFGETAADDYFLTKDVLSIFGAVGREVYLWGNINYRYANDWSLGYRAIYNANLCLELLADIERNEINQSEWDNVKGSALFFRSYYNLLLLDQFGLAYDSTTSEKDLGIVIRKTSDFNVVSRRANVKECYEAIQTDLGEALTFLPLHAQHMMRPSKTAALALLARMHLYKREYAQALKYADEALAINSQLMDYNSDPSIISLDSAVPFKPFNREIIFYAEMSSGFGLHAVARSNTDTLLYDQYDVNDLRRVAFFLDGGGYKRFKGTYSGQAAVLFTGLAVDELYLTRAECLAWLDRWNEGLSEVNLFLKKRWRNTVPFIPVAAGNKSEALDKIRMERRKTLLMRNLRWMDIKRQNKEGANIVPSRKVDGVIYTLVPNSASYALPLPIDIIEATGMPQN